MAGDASTGRCAGEGLLRRDLEAHLETCALFLCDHHPRGCAFQGTRAAVAEHLKQCKYESVKGGAARQPPPPDAGHSKTNQND